MTMEWGKDLILHFIEAYKSEPVIWCTSHRHHKYRRHHVEAWDRIAKRMNIEVADLKRKNKSILACYRAAHRKKKESIKTGEIYHPVWFAYGAMEEFLHPELAVYRPSGNNHTSNIQEIEEVTFQEDSDHAEYLNEDNEEDDVTYDTTSSEHLIKQEPQQPQKSKHSQLPKPQRSKLFNGQQAKPRLTIRTPIRKRIVKTNDSTLSDLRILETIKALKRSDCTKRQRDECDTFGEYIAESLRKHDDRTQSMIKQAINNILFEQEMKKYSSEQYVVITTETEEENPLILGDQDKS